eukprot:Blabericola_migrator_1__2167@NODE_159_length_12571_cov_158_810301_g139_i0_p2_GENE_NODE_159_length_12571_cov_158_810301_g139_i0NODE_159_length_12571_cov_158_810301_g139_i0_p2_ORF_typecomplete_len901_score80_94DUF1298/PF06974_13/9_7e15WES_acyltransf/PF03007_16/5_9e03WES_acyltransf/PF03007_16/1_9e12WES_acyltransf/PF03007_16/6_2e02GAPT/PF11770_8/9_2e03GAPT/PF11770_8/0_2_NODE_159_length_12571_cov_158_810301_g139_i0903111733
MSSDELSSFVIPRLRKSIECARNAKEQCGKQRDKHSLEHSLNFTTTTESSSADDKLDHSSASSSFSEAEEGSRSPTSPRSSRSASCPAGACLPSAQCSPRLHEDCQSTKVTTAASDAPGISPVSSNNSCGASALSWQSRSPSINTSASSEPRVWHHQSSMSQVCRLLGYLAGVAGGEIKLCEKHWSQSSNFGSQLSISLCTVRCAALLVRTLLNMLFMCASLILTCLFLPLLLFDNIRCVVFWMRSITASFAAYQDRVRQRRSSLFCGDSTRLVHSEDFECDFERWQSQPWYCANALNDCAFQVFFLYLHFFKRAPMPLPPRKFSDVLQHIALDLLLFRKHLASHPPAFPVQSSDEVFRFDKVGARFNLSMLFTMDRVSYPEVCTAFRERLIAWEPKMASVIVKQWGRFCFSPVANFDLTQHIHLVEVDLEHQDMATVMSEFGSRDFDQCKPLWQVLVVQPKKWSHTPPYTQALLETNFLPEGRDPEQVTFLMAKWSHVYADGVGTMATIVKRLGDLCVDMSGLPEKYRRQVPKWQVFLFWCYHATIAALQGLRLFLYMSYGLAPYPALIQSTDQLTMPLPQIGRKWYSTVASFKLDDINAVRDMIHARKKVRPTVNDIFAYCVAATAGRLRSRREIEVYLRSHLSLSPPSSPAGGNSVVWATATESSPNRHLRHNCLQSIIPMMCRTSVPSKMDNFTSLVCSRLPLPEHCWTSSNRSGDLVDELLRVKQEIDFLKSQGLRTTSFLITTLLFKSLPLTWAQSLFEKAFRSMQLCSTNVAAPGIESRFFGREVHGLYFWPAIPSTGTLGTSLVSLANRLQFLTIMDECEIIPALSIAEAIYMKAGIPFTDVDRYATVRAMAEIWRRLVAEEYEKLKYEVYNYESLCAEKKAAASVSPLTCH